VLACAPHVVDVLVPTPFHAEVALPIIEAGFAASAGAMLPHLRGEAPVPDLDADTPEHVMRALIAALHSSRLGRPVTL